MFLFKKNALLTNLIEQLEQIRSCSDTLVLVPSTTGYNWVGVNRATKTLFNTAEILELPQYYSNTLLKDKEIVSLSEKIKSCHFKTILFSGFPVYFEQIIRRITSKNSTIIVFYHGFISELSSNPIGQTQFKTLIELAQKKYVQKIAFNKKGLKEIVEQIWNIPCYKLLLKTTVHAKNTKLLSDNTPNIGIFGNDSFRKNIQNQIVAGYLYPNSILHINDQVMVKYLPDNQKRINQYSNELNHESFLELLAKMDINLHVSYSESWGQITSESLALGIPCLVSDHSDVLDYDLELKKKLTVQEYDNPIAIYDQIGCVLNDSSIRAQCLDYTRVVNQLADEFKDQLFNS